MKKLTFNNLRYLKFRSYEIVKKDGLLSFVKKLFKFIFSSFKIDLDAFVIDKDNTLDDLFIKFGSDKGSLDSKKTYDSIVLTKKPALR